MTVDIVVDSDMAAFKLSNLNCPIHYRIIYSVWNIKTSEEFFNLT